MNIRFFGIAVFMTLIGQAQELKVMTYNVKLDYPKEGDDSWINRRSFFIDQIKFYEPDIMGVQEPMPNPLFDLA